MGSLGEGCEPSLTGGKVDLFWGVFCCRGDSCEVACKGWEKSPVEAVKVAYGAGAQLKGDGAKAVLDDEKNGKEGSAEVGLINGE